MKARVKATGMIVEVTYSHTAQDTGYDIIWYITPQGDCFSKEELEFIDTGESLDYWTRLEHQYAGMAMQGLCANTKFMQDHEGDFQCNEDMIALYAKDIAHALMKKYKREEK